ncbi:conserved hypothetical protein [Vibrio chagasii]|nr:conserved hypothetical protein [Vibrio chagasii]
MYILNNEEVQMIDGGAGRGDSGSDRMERYHSSSNRRNHSNYPASEAGMKEQEKSPNKDCVKDILKGAAKGAVKGSVRGPGGAIAGGTMGGIKGGMGGNCNFD